MLLQIGLVERACKLLVDIGITLLRVWGLGVEKPHTLSPSYFFGTFFLSPFVRYRRRCYSKSQVESFKYREIGQV
jgi:hypothetical protein